MADYSYGNPYNAYDPNGTPIEELQARLMQIQGRVASTMSEVERVEGDVTERFSQISQSIDEISLEVFEIDSQTGLKSSRIDMIAGEISSKVSTTDYNGNTIASLINQTATTIKLKAENIDLDGITRVNQSLYLGNANNSGILNFNSSSSIYTDGDGLRIGSLGAVVIHGVQHHAGQIVTKSDGQPTSSNTGGGAIRVEGGNNLLHMGTGNTTNDRNAWIQSRHVSSEYSTTYGTLDLNPLGGNVKANGQHLPLIFGSNKIWFELTSANNLNVYKNGAYIGGIRLDYTA